MNSDPVTEDNYCRLARAILERYGGSYGEAMARLEQFQLNLICGSEIARSAALQAALLTAVNAGKRAFLGGVSVELPSPVQSLLPWPSVSTLDEIVTSLGARLARAKQSDLSHTLYFGATPDPVPDSLSVICSGWCGGVAPGDVSFCLDDQVDFALGGVMAGALGVGRGFLRVSGLSPNFVEQPLGFSLWRPDLPWTSKEARGPKLSYLPSKLWFMGLGHLGQAYLWNLILLPYARPNDTLFLLQDDDRVVSGNWVAGLLCEADSPGRLKTRLSAEQLELRGFNTRICERIFDETVRRRGDEPFVGICGFDTSQARRNLEAAGFALVVECGLGGSADSFDQFALHTFPEATRIPAQLWPERDGTVNKPALRMLEAFGAHEPCGVIQANLANKALSSSFVGAFAGALVIGELLRGLHGGPRCEVINGHLRSNSNLRVAVLKENFQSRLGLCGFTTSKT